MPLKNSLDENEKKRAFSVLNRSLIVAEVEINETQHYCQEYGLKQANEGEGFIAESLYEGALCQVVYLDRKGSVVAL